MKNCAFTIVFSLLSMPLESQTVAIELNYPTAWPGIDNPLTILVDGVACHHLYLDTDNGIIKTDENSCKYRYIPKSVGEGHFFIYSTTNNDTVLIEKSRIIVKRWPDQPAEFAGKTSGTVSLGEFFTQPGINARISGFDMSGSHKVNSYEIKVIRNGEIILALRNSGARFETDNSRKLEIVRGNDEVFFGKIMAMMPGENTPRQLNDISIKIQN